MQSGLSNRIPALDGWRGIAIFLVLFHHFHIIFSRWISDQLSESLSQLGVGIFFTLSGFLITGLLIDEIYRTGTADLRTFYLRRFFRLMPAAWVYLAAVAITFHGQRQSFIACLLFFRNYVNDPLFHQAATAHFWSLSIEEQFYLAWPALLLFTKPRRAVWIAAAGACLIALYRTIDYSTIAALPLFSTMQTQFRADGLLIGCAAAILLPRWKAYLRRWMMFPLLAIFLGSAMIPHRIVPLYESATVALLLMLAAAFPRGIIISMLTWKPLVYLGTISYSLYLWNQIFVVYLSSRQTVGTLIFALALTPAAAMASYYVIEKPSRRLGARVIAATAS